MLDYGMVGLCGAGCVAAIVCAAHSPRNGRWEAVALSCLLIVNWTLFILAYGDWSPSWNLGKVGIEVSSVHLWMLADAIGGCAAVAIAHRFWWGWALWSASMAQIGFHAGMDANLYPAVFYTDKLLNFALLVQLMIFFAIGGAGVANRLHHCLALLRISRGLDAPRAASSRKAAR